jgi:hypothetical protein
MLCAAKGGWVEPTGLVAGWRMDFDSISTDFQSCQLPKRKDYSFRTGTQRVESSPRLREFLAFPRLTIFVLSGAEYAWFRCPVNPLLFGRAEDLLIAKEVTEDVEWNACGEAELVRQCLPIPLGSGPLYSAPLYFEPGRVPVAMSPKIDARNSQLARVNNGREYPRLARLNQTGEAFFLWDFGRVAG